MSTTVERRKLPIGIQNFRKVRAERYYYVDKTSYIERLLNEGKHYFLSRPRRFGKSLFLDTLKELFEGHEGLFEDLWIHRRWDWSQQYPVIRLSFGSGHFGTHEGLQSSLTVQLDRIEREIGSDTSPLPPLERFGELIRSLRERTGERTVVLIDEYDKPILDALDVPSVARLNRDYLRGLYAVIKDSDAHIRFSFITGVSKFSKVSLFSGLNNLMDITIEPQYSAVCGYTESDLDSVFATELQGLDRARIREWYNGYSWRGEEKVYNPFDILLLFHSREFEAHWFETGTPTFLVETLFRRRISSVDLDGTLASGELLSSFDVTVEDSTNQGRLDMALRFEGRVYVFEFKVVEQAGKEAAMAQLKQRNYAEKYSGTDSLVCLVAVEFRSKTRNIVSFDVERL